MTQWYDPGTGYVAEDEEQEAEIEAGQTAQLGFPNTVVTGDLLLHRTNQSDQPLGGACFDIVGPNYYDDSVCDNSAPDEDPDGGEILLTGVDPGEYEATETTPPSGYSLDVNPQSITVPPGDLGEGAFSSGCASTQQLVPSGVDWHDIEDAGFGSFDGEVLRLLEPNYTGMETLDLCVATAANGLPASFTLTARLQLDAADRMIFAWVMDPTDYDLVLGFFVTGTAPEAGSPWDGGVYGIYGPSAAYVVEAYGGFADGEDIEVTLTWDAATGEVTVRFEQGARVETLSDEDAQDPPYELSGDWGILVEGVEWASEVDEGTVGSIDQMTFDQS